MKLKDKVAIITGAGRGIGRAYALRFAAEGAKVVIAEIDFHNAQAVAQQISAQGQEAFALNTDVSDEKSTQQMAEETIKRFGRIDILVIYGLARLVDAIKWNGARVGIQLFHAGRQKFVGTYPMVAPSRVPWEELLQKGGVIPTELTLKRSGKL